MQEYVICDFVVLFILIVQVLLLGFEACVIVEHLVVRLLYDVFQILYVSQNII